MNILLLAPQPFYSERGTPIAVRAVIETLASVGHRVDVLTYHEGTDIVVDGVRLVRSKRPPLVRRVPIGPSWQKAACDAGLMSAASRLLKREHYDLLHGVEEGALAAAFLGRRSRTPFIYDMDSLMSEQLRERGTPFLAAAPVFAAMERWALQRAAGVLAVCPYLLGHARRFARPGVPVDLLPDFPLPGVEDAAPDPEIASIQGLKFIYVGNLESYQGIDLMLGAFTRAAQLRRDIALVVVGGRPSEVGRLSRLNRGMVAAGRMRFLGARPPARLGGILAAADVLLSPRTKGRNTPMKIYSYLASGSPVLATRLPTHTQVLDPNVAMLTDPTPAAMAMGMLQLADDTALRARLGAAARQLVEEKYSRARFRERLLGFYEQLARNLGGGDPSPRPVPAVA